MTDVAKQSGIKTTLKNSSDECCQTEWKENHLKNLNDGCCQTKWKENHFKNI